jgi:hypothetical protein
MVLAKFSQVDRTVAPEFGLSDILACDDYVGTSFGHAHPYDVA